MKNVNGVHYIGFPLYFNYKSCSIISCSQFSKHWLTCNYDAECILTTLNDLYYVEWFVLSWVICIYNVECFFDYVDRFALLFCWMIWTVQWNFLPKNITRKIASEFSLPWKPQLWTLPHKKSLLVEIPLVIIALQQTKKQTLKSKVMKIKASGILILQKSSTVHQNYIP